MNVSHQLQQIGLFLAQGGFITILEQMSVSAVATIEGNCIPSQKPPHQGSHGSLTGLQQKKHMTGDKRPRQTRGLGFLKDSSEPFKEVIPVGVILKNFPLLDPPGDDMVQSPRCVNS